MKNKLAASLLVLAGLSLAGSAGAAEKTTKLRVTNKVTSNSLQVAAGQTLKKPVHLEAVRTPGGGTSSSGISAGGAGILAGKVKIEKPAGSLGIGLGSGNSGIGLGNGIQVIKTNDAGMNASGRKPGGQIVTNGKISTQILGNLGASNGSAKVKLDAGIVGKLKLVKPIDPGFGAKHQDPFAKCNSGNKCSPCKPWNPWCGPWNPWYPCVPHYDPCDPCCHWHPIHTIVYVECVPVYVCDPVFVAEPIVVLPEQPLADLELVDVRLIDQGLPAEKLGPGYRLLVKNNSPIDVLSPFQVTLLATLGDEPTAKSPRGQAELDRLLAGQTAVVDLRLPLEALNFGQSPAGLPLAFSKLVAVLDSRQQVPELSEKNNAAALEREKIAPVQPRILGFDRPANQGGEIVVMGEGFGDAPGSAYMVVGGLKLKLETKGWMTHAVRVTLPEMASAEAAEVKLQVLRADGEASAAELAPATAAE